jgi:sugar phosphate isomerase/epimerase/protein-tyrosine-phosphatase
MFRHYQLLFVGRGNTGLAQAAEVIAQRKLDYWMDRRGVVGRSATLPNALLEARPGRSSGRFETGYDYDFADQTLTPELVMDADLIVTMNQIEQRVLAAHYPKAADKIVWLGEMAGAQQELSVPDEFTGHHFDTLCGQLQGWITSSLETMVARAEAVRRQEFAQVGLNTDLSLLQYPPSSDEERFLIAAQSGVGYVDWDHDMYDDVIYDARKIDQIAQLYEEHGVRCRQTHGFESRQTHAVAEGEALDRYVAVQKSRVELCARLGGDTVVIHIPGIFWGHLGISLQEAMSKTTRALDQLRPLCEDLGVRLAVENYGRDSSERLDFYFNHYPASFISVCLDIGHANIAGDFEQLKGYADRLNVLHLHDNNGQQDLHQPPLDGTLDWAAFMQWLNEIHFTGVYNFELLYRRDLFPGTLPEFMRHSVGRMRRVLQ